MMFQVDKRTMCKVLMALSKGNFGNVSAPDFDAPLLLNTAWDAVCSHSKKRTWSLLERSSLVIDGRSVVCELRDLLPMSFDRNIHEYIDRISLSRQTTMGELEACLYVSN